MQQLKSNGHSTLWTGSHRTDSVKESNFPHLVDGGGGRGGTSCTKRGFKRVYDFSVEPSHSVSQWTRAHCDNRPHCVRFRLGSKTARDSVQKIAQNKGVSIWKTFIVKKDRTRAKERDRRWEQWCWLKFWYYEQSARICWKPIDASHITVSCYHSLSDQSVQCGFVARSPNHSKRGISIITVSGS